METMRNRRAGRRPAGIIGVLITLLSIGLSGSVLAPAGPGFAAEAPAVTASPGGPTVDPAERDARKRVFFCQGRKATIVGGNGRDQLMGTRRADVIVGRGGGDYIAGLGGNDRVCGGRGNDVLEGGRGRDRLTGQSGQDYCMGEDREHRRHRSCEAHAPQFDLDLPQSAPSRSAAQKARPLPSAPVQMVEGDNWFLHDEPWCTHGQIDYRTFQIRGGYTDPAYVWVGTAIAYWNYDIGKWDPSGGNTFIDRPYWQLPGDSNFYTVNAGAWQVRKNQLSLSMHIVAFWDGAQWVSYRGYLAPYYHSAVSMLRTCTT